MKKILFLLLFLCSCSHRTIDITFNQIKEANTYTFKNTTKKDVQVALAKVFRLAKDDRTTNMSANEKSLHVKTLQNLYIIIGFGQIITNLTFDLTENGQEVKVNILNKQKIYGNTLLIFYNYAEILSNNKALNDLIFKRTNYLLGKTNKWYTCDEYNKYAKENNIMGTTEPICLFASDISPESKKGQEILNKFTM